MKNWKAYGKQALLVPVPWILALLIFDHWTATHLFFGYIIGLVVATIGRRYGFKIDLPLGNDKGKKGG